MSGPIGDGDLQALRDRPGRLPLSVVVTTYNEEINILDCLESVLWADEILVVDSYSTDQTLELARRYPVRILQREYYGSAAQKNWALDRVTHDWVLVVDADERVSEELAKEVLETLSSEPRYNGFAMRRRNVVLGKMLRFSGWAVDHVVRLFRKDRARYPDRRVHADTEVDGPTPLLKQHLIHYTFRSFDQYYEKFSRYAEWGAAQLYREGKRAGWLEIAGRPFWRFLRMYFLQLGILDGRHGLMVSTLEAFGVFLKYARLWEYRLRESRGEEIRLPAFDTDRRTWDR